MTFARRRADTPWAGTLDPVELQLMDRDISRAIDGFAGGAYAPSSVLTIGGAGLTVTALLTASAGLNVAGGISANSLNVTGDVLILDDLTVADLLTVQGASALQGNVTVSGTVVATGNIDAPTGTIDLIEAFATTTGSLIVNGVSTLTGAVAINGGGTLAGILTKSGAGRIRDRVVNASNSNSSYSVSTADVVVARSVLVTAARDYTILDAGAVGEEMEVHNWTGFVMTLKNEGAATIGTVPVVAGTLPLHRPGIARLRYEDDGFGARWLVIKDT